MYKMFDGGGLFLQVNPSGGKHWKMKYRKDDGKEGLLTFGSYPAVTLEQARKKREEARANKAAGLDPGEVKRKEKAERTERAKNTFEAVARAWMEVHSTKVKPQTIDILKGVLEKFVFPIIGRVPVRSLKAPDFLDVLRRLEAQDRLYTAKRANIACSLVMRFAVATGLFNQLLHDIDRISLKISSLLKGHPVPNCCPRGKAPCPYRRSHTGYFLLSAS